MYVQFTGNYDDLEHCQKLNTKKAKKAIINSIFIALHNRASLFLKVQYDIVDLLDRAAMYFLSWKSFNYMLVWKVTLSN